MWEGEALGSKHNRVSFCALYVYNILLGCQSNILSLLTTVTFFSIQSVAFLGNSRGAPMTCNLSAPLPLNSQSLPSSYEIDLTESAEFKQLEGRTLCLFIKSKRSWKEGGQPLSFCHKKSLMLSRYWIHYFLSPHQYWTLSRGQDPDIHRNFI